MKNLVLLLVVAVLASGAMFAQEKLGTPAKVKIEKTNMWHGYVVDAMCAKGMAKKPESAMKSAANHTLECALNEDCAASGFGIFTDGKYVKFDETGDKKALELLQNTKTEKAIAVMVTGEMKGDKLAVASISEEPMGMKEMKMEKKAGEKMMEKKPAEKSGK